MSFFYFTPAIVNAADYERLGLSYAFDKLPNVTQINRNEGPGGLAGTMLHLWPGPQMPLGLRWHQARENLWIGWSPFQRPTARTLRRPVELAVFTSIRLADGEFWAVPRVLVCAGRDRTRQSGLPEVYHAQRDGEPPQRKLPDVYKPLIAQAERTLAAFEETGTGQLPEGECLDFAANVLAVGYRVTKHELLALELLTPLTCQAIVMDAIDGLERTLMQLPPEFARSIDQAGIVSWASILQINMTAPPDEDE